MPQNPQFSQRSQGGFSNSILGALLGREMNPSEPDIQQVGIESLIREQNDAQAGGDQERLAVLRQMIEQRNPQNQQQPLTSAENPQQAGGGLFSGLFDAVRQSNPFHVTGEAQREARQRGGY